MPPQPLPIPGPSLVSVASSASRRQRARHFFGRRGNALHGYGRGRCRHPLRPRLGAHRPRRRGSTSGPGPHRRLIEAIARVRGLAAHRWTVEVVLRGRGTRHTAARNGDHDRALRPWWQSTRRDARRGSVRQERRGDRPARVSCLKQHGRPTHVRTDGLLGAGDDRIRLASKVRQDSHGPARPARRGAALEVWRRDPNAATHGRLARLSGWS